MNPKEELKKLQSKNKFPIYFKTYYHLFKVTKNNAYVLMNNSSWDYDCNRRSVEHPLLYSLNLDFKNQRDELDDFLTIRDCNTIINDDFILINPKEFYDKYMKCIKCICSLVYTDQKALLTEKI